MRKERVKLRKYVRLVVLTLIFTGAASAASGQSNTAGQVPESPAHAVDVTPFVSMDSKFSWRGGAAIGVAWRPNTKFEAEVAVGDGPGRRADMLSANLSLIHSLQHLGRVLPYVAAGAGLESYEVFAVLGSETNGVAIGYAGLASTFNTGGGLRIRINENWTFRADARWFQRLKGGTQHHYRVYGGVSIGVHRRHVQSARRSETSGSPNEE